MAKEYESKEEVIKDLVDQAKKLNYNLYKDGLSFSGDSSDLICQFFRASSTCYEGVFFTLQATPHCCAMNFLHHFSCTSSIDRAFLKFTMDFFLARMTQFVGAGDNNRVILNMVETRSGTPMDAHHRVESIENPNIQYKPIFDYFHANSDVRTLLMVNQNTGRIIHHMECVFPANYFEDK